MGKNKTKQPVPEEVAKPIEVAVAEFCRRHEQVNSLDMAYALGFLRGTGEVAVKPPMTPLAVDARQLATLLTCSLRQIWRLRATKKLTKEICLGGAIPWNRREVLDWFEARCPCQKTWQQRQGREHHSKG